MAAAIPAASPPITTRRSATAAGYESPWETSGMAVREDCRHYSSRSMPAGDVVQRCRVDVTSHAVRLPGGCLFFEPRSITDAGWLRFEPDDDE